MRNRGGCCLPIFLSVFILAGIGMIVWGASILKNASVSSDWPSTQGEIVSSYVREDSDEDGTTYHAEVSYAYVANDQRHTNNTVSFGQYGSSNPDHAENIINRYTVGKIVTVYYDPASPETAVLEPGITWSSYLVLGLGIIFAILPAVIFIGTLFRTGFRLFH